MSKCRRCNNSIVSLTGITCICGEPFAYVTYMPGERERIKISPGAMHQKIVSKSQSLYLADEFILEIKRFCAKYSFPQTVFGRKFANDANLVNRLMNGATPRQGTIEAIRGKMRAYANG
jgi:hypothetical protein